MIRRCIVCLITAYSLLGSAFAQATKTGTAQRFNPIIPDFIADPSVVMFRDTFYMYATTDIDRGLEKMGPPVVWKSTDFVNWHFSGILETGINWDRPYTYKDTKGNDKTGYFRYWAPGKTLFQNGTYYLFPTIVKPDGSVGTYVMTGRKPDGPFSFTNGTGIYFNEPEKTTTETKPLIDDIDGEPFVDDDGKTYIYWRRRMAAALSSDLLTLAGDKVQIPTKYGGYSEGPGLFKRNNIYYYFYTLSGNASYHNGYMMSREGPLSGFKNPDGNNIFIFSDTSKGVWGPGHGNVFKMPGKDAFYFLYLEYGEGSTTRQVFVNKMEFNADGTLKPVEVNSNGVAYLVKSAVSKKINLALNANVSASSYKKDRLVKGTITPNPDMIKPNVRLATISAERTFSYIPANAADASNGTRWMADTADKKPWIMFDLGKIKKISSVEMYFVTPVYGHAWTMEKSTDGKNWTVSATEKTQAVKSPHVAANIGKARYIRIHINKGTAGLWECKIFE